MAAKIVHLQEIDRADPVGQKIKHAHRDQSSVQSVALVI